MSVGLWLCVSLRYTGRGWLCCLSWPFTPFLNDLAFWQLVLSQLWMKPGSGNGGNPKPGSTPELCGEPPVHGRPRFDAQLSTYQSPASEKVP